jgi:hypothetical protein
VPPARVSAVQRQRYALPVAESTCPSIESKFPTYVLCVVCCLLHIRSMRATGLSLRTAVLEVYMYYR